MKRELKRVRRTLPIPPEQAARDREIRDKVQAEFPPLEPAPIPDSLSDALKTAIRSSDRTVYQIARDAHVSQIVVSRFLSGERDIRMGTADRLARALGLKLVEQQ